MKRSRFTDEQVAYARRQVDGCTGGADVCRQGDISGFSFAHFLTVADIDRSLRFYET